MLRLRRRHPNVALSARSDNINRGSLNLTDDLEEDMIEGCETDVLKLLLLGGLGKAEAKMVRWHFVRPSIPFIALSCG